MEPCVFCNVPDEDIIAENDLAFAIFDRFPVNEGHVLVIPKRHVATYFDASTDELAACHRLILEVKPLLEERFGATGLNLGVNVGVDAGQTIMHLHIHVIPRYTGDVENPRGGVRNLKPNLVEY